MISIAMEDDNSIIIRPDSDAQKMFNIFLEDFDEDHQQLENDPYSGGDKEGRPKAFNNAIKLISNE